jgi:hypothetical protein
MPRSKKAILADRLCRLKPTARDPVPEAPRSPLARQPRGEAASRCLLPYLLKAHAGQYGQVGPRKNAVGLCSGDHRGSPRNGLVPGIWRPYREAILPMSIGWLLGPGS